MARRQSRRPASLTAYGLALAMALLVSACAPGQQSGRDQDSMPASMTGSTVSSTTGATATTTTSVATTTTEATTTTTPLSPRAPEGAVIGVPEGDGPFPSIVLVHGGGWIVGTPESMQPLADFLTDEGYLTVNATYQLSLQAPGFPSAVEDVVCAMAFAAGHEKSDGTVAIIGHSAGAHVGAIAALDPGGFDDRCSLADGVPDQFVGLAGPYDSNRLPRIMAVFFGGERADISDIWDSGNPLLLAELNPSLRALLIHGDSDTVVPIDFSREFLDALVGGGSTAELAELAGSAHADARNPALVGDLIVDWLEDE